MAQVVQACFATGWGGLEMVICDFHQWLQENKFQSKILCLENSPLHQNSLKRGFGSNILTVPRGFQKASSARKILRSLDSKSTTLLFHRQQGAKWLGLRKLQAKKAILCHTFYGVEKKDFWHNLLFSQIDQWIVHTSSHKENLMKTITVKEDKIRIIPNGVDLQKFRPKAQRDFSQKQIHIGVSARLDPQKGQDIALKALKKLDRSDITLHLFGDNTPDAEPYRPYLENLVRELGLESQVVFEGYEDDMSGRLPEMDLVWMPSYQETFGRCLIEAMACGIPVIASNAGGVPDIIQSGHNGILFETRNPDDLAQQTQTLLGDDQLRYKLIANGLQDAQEKYNIEIIWQRLLHSIHPSFRNQTESAPFETRFSWLNYFTSNST